MANSSTRGVLRGRGGREDIDDREDIEDKGEEGEGEG